MARKKIAAIVTTYFDGSHADLLVSRFVTGFPTPSGLVESQVDVVSMYMEQLHPQDIGVEFAREHGIELFPSIRSALTLQQPMRGPWPTAPGWEIGELAVDGVLIIAEHGDYSPNERGRQLYPRRHFFEQVCGMIGLSGRAIPVFSDKHLAYSWDDARWMYDRAKELGIPFMAGSSLPVTGRTPWFEHEIGAEIDEALVLATSTPIRTVSTRTDSTGWRPCSAWSSGGEAARRESRRCGASKVPPCGRPPSRACGRETSPPRRNRASRRSSRAGWKTIAFVPPCSSWSTSMAFAPRHSCSTGTRGASRTPLSWTARPSAPGSTRATTTIKESFGAQGLAVHEMFLTGQPQYPVERSLLTTGTHAALMDSRYLGGVRIETPWLDVSYKPPVA